MGVGYACDILHMEIDPHSPVQEFVPQVHKAQPCTSASLLHKPCHSHYEKSYHNALAPMWRYITMSLPIALCNDHDAHGCDIVKRRQPCMFPGCCIMQPTILYVKNPGRVHMYSAFEAHFMWKDSQGHPMSLWHDLCKGHMGTKCCNVHHLITFTFDMQKPCLVNAICMWIFSHVALCNALWKDILPCESFHNWGTCSQAPFVGTRLA